MRIDYAATAPEGYKALLAMYGYLKKTDLAPALLHMIWLRVSQINGCPYCVDLHWKDAIAAGTEPRKLNGVSNWKHMPFFSAAEKAALAFAEEMTLLPAQEVSASVFDAARLHFDDKDLTDLSLAIAHMNMLNRVAITFHKVPVL
ncbi:carboxymuconolactone decarboxylase family protein [Niabella drilacis]|uniref:Alkylhydroperoxidase AhpD family core domain-containing protein n=1 Tax=Niabella drilacis (strain DSM 25811 / CCM 8410 / CCUG 62505 / LMG 26954 / E90) TaxID=1285928 RepID=A0A1G6IRY3_NIADE|nr:carboxymuconolactone decarboxylase family protein [Niabella drilacis]SDC09267.1 alkylhydroperoxidase AhpD family core domain-containing protein [Niabella drilacis]